MTDLQLPRMTCEKCGRSYPWKKHKRYCSEECAKKAAAARVSQRSRELMELPIAQMTPSMVEVAQKLKGDPRQIETMVMIVCNAPPNAVGYRVGCLQPDGGGENPRIRWFPSQVYKRPAIFSLKPFEDPKVPFPYYYTVAYFDEYFVLTHTPYVSVGIEVANSSRPWSAGDRNLKIDSNAPIVPDMISFIQGTGPRKPIDKP